jgi:hypothetical protein
VVKLGSLCPTSADSLYRWVSIAGGAQLAIGNRSECQDVPSLGGAAGIWAQRGVT